MLSARYSGPAATDAGNNQKLLEALRDVPRENRGAQFVCHICVADPSGAVRGESAASCRGRILFAPAAAVVLATIRSSRSWNTIAVSAC